MEMPKATDADKEWFRSIVPDADGVTTKSMFGGMGAFVNGNMFLGLHGQNIAVRLPDDARAELLRVKGASEFEPMPGRVMKEYVVLPAAWRKDRAKAERWVNRSLEHAAALPPKQRKRP